MRKKIFMVIVVMLLIMLKVGSFIAFHGEEGLNRLLSFKALSDKYAGEYYNEYIQWEARMIQENPDYDDLKILVDISEKTLYLLNGNELIKKYPIASGRPGNPSPLGSWKIINKARWGGGFGTRWMGLNVPWGKFGIHGTNKPNSIGYNASAGCIRMNNRDVEDLYKYVKHGTPVAIANGLHGPFGYGLQTIKPGDFGADVMEVQRRLRALGYYKTDYLDGKYGPMMEEAVYRFQRDNNLPKNPHIGWEMYNALGIILME
ncbi:L,D-transpeptidase family protein [Clostridium formicaceticum]|uniref:L,D-transpeptidase YkuD n=1 Tax=Clostridium formicaceticum TaxID=1497 RepID=A0AAC9WI68_9CLOT|nr:L,D-transpeptidase family protein [Clostridium formicaceticum]ARE89474.1 Putative L,D-transpeptidase YkuD [Clostridium formicaceticum]